MDNYYLQISARDRCKDRKRHEASEGATYMKMSEPDAFIHIMMKIKQVS